MDEPALVENRTFDEIAARRERLARAHRSPGATSSSTPPSPATPTRPISTRRSRGRPKMPGVVAHGMLTAGLISNLLGNRLPGAGTVYVAQDLRFAAPVHAGDRDHGSRSPCARSRPRAGWSSFDCDCTNQDGRGRARPATATVVAPTEKRNGAGGRAGRLHLQDHDHYEALIARDNGDPADPLRGGASLRRARCAGRSKRPRPASSCRSWSAPPARSGPWRRRPGWTSPPTRSSTRRTAMTPPRRRSSWSRPAGPSC